MTRWIFVVLLVALAGCGGGGGSSAPVAPGTPTQTATASGSSIVSTIVVPGATTSQSGQRAPQYVSASTLGLRVVVTDIPPTGGQAAFSATTSVYQLGVGSNQIVIPTPTTTTGHTEDLTYVAYNAAPVSGAIPGGAKALAWGLTTGFVALPGQNTNNIVLSGVADGFPAALAQVGAFGMMGANPPVPVGQQVSFGFGANAAPSGIASLFDGGGNDISTAAGNPWPVVGAVPGTATTAATGVPVTIAESAGTCGALGPAPHLQISYNGGALATSAAITKTSDTVELVYDGDGGAGWSAVVTAKGQTSTLTYNLSSLGTTAVPNPANTTDWSCTNQTLSFSQPAETALVTIVEHTAATPYTLTIPSANTCTQLVNVYTGNSTLPANSIPEDGNAHSLGAGVSTFTIQLIAAPQGYFACNIKIQDANAASTGGAAYPGATTYVQAVLPNGETFITVP